MKIIEVLDLSNDLTELSHLISIGTI